MIQFMKKLTAIVLSVIMTFGILTVCASAEDKFENLYVYDTLILSCDSDAARCYSAAIFFSLQFNHYDSSLNIELVDESGTVCAKGTPSASDLSEIYFVSVDDDSVGAKISYNREYILRIPAGTFYMDNGSKCAEYTRILPGIFFLNSEKNYDVVDLSINSFFSMSATETTLYMGKLYFNTRFTETDASNCTITLFQNTTVDGKTVYVEVGKATVTSMLSGLGCAEIDFGAGVTIDKYASYRIEVRYASFFNSSRTLCANSVYDLSGKKLLGLREDYPVIDLLIKWFGADSKVLDVVVSALNILSKVKLVDGAFASDIKNYVKSK